MRKIAIVLLSSIFVLLSACSEENKTSSKVETKVEKQTTADKKDAAGSKKETKKLVTQAKTITYRVFNKSYQVMGTSKDYNAKGVASWYGPGFNNKMTSSGERYNMYNMTAAHKTLPLATYVQVTNLLNGKKVVVKVNDRGPFVSNRLIDLSFGAAKKLGMVGRGLAPVEVKAL